MEPRRPVETNMKGSNDSFMKTLLYKLSKLYFRQLARLPPTTDNDPTSSRVPAGLDPDPQSSTRVTPSKHDNTGPMDRLAGTPRHRTIAPVTYLKVRTLHAGFSFQRLTLPKTGKMRNHQTFLSPTATTRSTKQVDTTGW